MSRIQAAAILYTRGPQGAHASPDLHPPGPWQTPSQAEPARKREGGRPRRLGPGCVRRQGLGPRPRGGRLWARVRLAPCPPPQADTAVFPGYLQKSGGRAARYRSPRLLWWQRRGGRGLAGSPHRGPACSRPAGRSVRRGCH